MEKFKMFWSKSIGTKIIIIVVGFMLLGMFGDIFSDEVNVENNASSKEQVTANESTNEHWSLDRALLDSNLIPQTINKLYNIKIIRN